MKTRRFLPLCQSLVICAKLLYDYRKTLSAMKQCRNLKFGRNLVLSATMIDLDDLSADLPEACLKYLRPPPDRKMILVANLKMNGNKGRLEKYCDCINKTVVCLTEEQQKQSRGRLYKCQLYPDLVDIVIAPPYPYLEIMSNKLRKDCEACRECNECLDCTKCKTCECANCKQCNLPLDDPCCKDQCLMYEGCDQEGGCKTLPPSCQSKGICECEDCGLCAFCQTCYATDCEDCATCIQTGAQNAFPYLSGGLSGEISPRQIRETGGRWVIVGSSERRQLFNETDALLMHKLRCALFARLKVVYCVSDECKDESCDTLEKQVMAVMPKIGLPTESGENNDSGDPNRTKFTWVGKENGYFTIDGLQDWDNIVIAYEPLWALKKGLVPTPEEAEAKCSFIRTLISEEISEEVAKKIRILYGGPVDSDTAQEYAQQPSIDGFYIGTTAFKLDQLIQIANAWFIRNRPDAKDIVLPDFGEPQPCIVGEDEEENKEEGEQIQ